MAPFGDLKLLHYSIVLANCSVITVSEGHLKCLINTFLLALAAGDDTHVHKSFKATKKSWTDQSEQWMNVEPSEGGIP